MKFWKKKTQTTPTPNVAQQIVTFYDTEYSLHYNYIGKKTEDESPNKSKPTTGF